MSQPSETPDLIGALRALGPAILDAWYVVDDQDKIVEFNPAFHALFPRSISRNLKTLGCRDALSLPPCTPGECLRSRCQAQGPFRLDELDASVAGEALRFTVSATPISLEGGKQGALIVLRNVTDDARVQARYQEMMARAEAEKRDLQARLDARTRDLLSANTELSRLEQELARTKRGF